MKGAHFASVDVLVLFVAKSAKRMVGAGWQESVLLEVIFQIT